jgi:3-hydroxyisobutyrate dehydrogenase
LLTKIAVVGLGTMGLPIARNLIAAGHDVIGIDLDPARVELLGAPTGRPAGADVVVCSVPSAAAVDAVAREVRETCTHGTLFVDMSTSPPSLARRLAKELGSAGIEALDAPVSGGPIGAEAATLTIMVGGDAPAFERGRPILESLGRLVAHVGGPGAGQAAKLCNNLIAGANMAALAEACELAQREGIGAATLYELLTASTGDSRVLRNRFPLPGVDDAHPASHAWAPLFTLDLMVKDLGLALDLAAEHGLDAQVAETALARYRAAREAGHGGLDYSAVFLAVTLGAWSDSSASGKR